MEYKLIKKGSSNSRLVAELQSLLNMVNYNLKVDGDFGDKTESAVRDFQTKYKLGVDGVVGTGTWTVLLALTGLKLSSKFLSESDYVKAADDLDVTVAVVKAVKEVESAGRGFVGEKPIMVFEGHIFWRELKELGINPSKYRKGNEDILYPSWDVSYHKGTMTEYDQLERAKLIYKQFDSIDLSSKSQISFLVEDAALESCSWGLFQVMGFNWESLGYSSIDHMVDKMYEHEREHLDAFIRYVKVNKLDTYLKNLDWAKFARGYNGPGYKANNYDVKLKNAYNRYRKLYIS